MKKRISLYVRSVLTFLRIVITKIFNIKGFHSAFIQDFSITTKISVNERGKILLKKHILSHAAAREKILPARR